MDMSMAFAIAMMWMWGVHRSCRGDLKAMLVLLNLQRDVREDIWEEQERQANLKETELRAAEVIRYTVTSWCAFGCGVLFLLAPPILSFAVAVLFLTTHSVVEALLSSAELRGMKESDSLYSRMKSQVRAWKVASLVGVIASLLTIASAVFESIIK